MFRPSSPSSSVQLTVLYNMLLRSMLLDISFLNMFLSCRCYFVNSRVHATKLRYAHIKVLVDCLMLWNTRFRLGLTYTGHDGTAHSGTSVELIVMSENRLLHESLAARGRVVVKALCYKPEGRGLDTRLGEFLNLPNPSGRTRPRGLLSL
jgi:hypothetical protein